MNKKHLVWYLLVGISLLPVASTVFAQCQICDREGPRGSATWVCAPAPDFGYQNCTAEGGTSCANWEPLCESPGGEEDCRAINLPPGDICLTW